MFSRRQKCSAFSLPVKIVVLASVLLKLSLLSSVASQSTDVVNAFFVDPDVKCLNHLVVDKNTGQVYVTGVNRLYQFSPNLDLIIKSNTGPSDGDENPTKNVNKALVIDYSTSGLIVCGTLSQGSCTVRRLQNISDVIQEVHGAIVANDAASSTVAFIAPGPSNQSASHVMYVGLTKTANSPSNMPAVSSRSLAKERMLEIAETTATAGTKMFVNSMAEQQSAINYVHGFSNDGFSYFLTTQPKNTTAGREFITKLVRVCQNDPNYYSYTEIPVDCTNGLTKYNLVQAAYVGKAGSDLAKDLGITEQEDVLYAVFSESIHTSDNHRQDSSALCIYSLKAIRKKFTSNIQNCAAGHGQTGLDFISPIIQCAPTPLQNISDDFCGYSENPILGGEDSVSTSPVLSFGVRLTAVVATVTGNDTVVFVGTGDGHLEKIVVQTATSGRKYDDLVIDPNSQLNSEMHFDRQSMNLYVMTQQKVFKVNVQNCSSHKTCSDCLSTKDPYCGWCILENKCSLMRDCEVVQNTPLHWITYKNGKCPIITSVTPNLLPKATTTSLALVVENLPRLTGRFRCAFTIQSQTLITDARREENNLYCTTPSHDLLPPVLQNEHYLATTLSVRRTIGPDLASTSFTFFDCPSYTSCTECVDSTFPCKWCISTHTCNHGTNENCDEDYLVTGFNESEIVSSRGPEFCPRIIETDFREILVYSGLEKALKFKVYSLRSLMVQTRFLCQFNIEGRITSTIAQLLADTIYCDPLDFSYTSNDPSITVPVAVIWGGRKALSNPNDIHVVIYRCENMAENSDTCLALDKKYGCGWCESSSTCGVRQQCDTSSSRWLNK